MGQPEHGWHSDETRVLVRLDDYQVGNRNHTKCFVAGAKRDEDLQRRIQSESDEYGDIIQADRCVTCFEQNTRRWLKLAPFP